MGEVVDGTSASRTLKSKRFSDCLDCCNTDEKNELFSLATGLSQGEGDDMLDNNFYAPPLIFPLLGNHLAIWLLISSFRRIKVRTSYMKAMPSMTLMVTSLAEQFTFLTLEHSFTSHRSFVRKHWTWKPL